MIPRERENRLYKSGKRCEIAKEEGILFEYLDKISDRGSRVLDIGAGSGDITYKIKEKGFSVTGVDFSEEGVKLTRRLGLNCLVVDLDNGIPFDDGVFDIVWAGDIIEHLFDPIFVLKEVNRVLVPGGLLLATIPYDLKLSNRLRILLGRSYQESVYRRFRQHKHHTFFSKGLLKYMLRETSFDIEEINFKSKIPLLQKKFITKYAISLPFSETMIIRARANKS